MYKCVLLMLVVIASAFGQGQAPDLRAAAGCGPAKTEFDVKTDKHQHSVAQPEASKALVYVIVEQKSDPANSSPLSFGSEKATTRVGLDGKWVGANHGESYLSFAVEPGDHRVCTDWQSSLRSIQKLSGAANLSAEAAKTYYYRVEVTIPWKEHAAELKLHAVDEAEGLLLISKSSFSTWKARN
jgi:hypothetical protein